MKVVDEETEALLEPLRRVDVQLTEQAGTLEAQLKVIRDRRKRVRQAIRSLDPVTPPKRKPRTKKVQHVSDAVVNKVTGAIMDGAETKAEIMAATDLSESSVTNAIKRLRADEAIRKAGVREGTRQAVYKPMNPVPAHA